MADLYPSGFVPPPPLLQPRTDNDNSTKIFKLFFQLASLQYNNQPCETVLNDIKSLVNFQYDGNLYYYILAQNPRVASPQDTLQISPDQLSMFAADRYDPFTFTNFIKQNASRET